MWRERVGFVVLNCAIALTVSCSLCSPRIASGVTLSFVLYRGSQFLFEGLPWQFPVVCDNPELHSGLPPDLYIVVRDIHLLGLDRFLYNGW